MLYNSYVYGEDDVSVVHKLLESLSTLKTTKNDGIISNSNATLNTKPNSENAEDVHLIHKPEGANIQIKLNDDLPGNVSGQGLMLNGELDHNGNATNTEEAATPESPQDVLDSSGGEAEDIVDDSSFSCGLSSDLLQMLLSKTSTDIQLITDGDGIRCHR